MKLHTRSGATGASLLALLMVGGGCRTQSPNPALSAKPNQVAPAPTLLIKTAPVKAAFPADDLGRAVKLQAPAQRVVVIGPGATESLFAIGAGGNVVGRDSASTYPARALKAPVAGDYQGPNVEQVVTLKPDLIVVQGETYGATRADDWQTKTGVPVAILAATTLDGVAKGISKLGAWTGHQTAAQSVARTFVFSPLAGAGRAANNGAKQRAFFEMSRAPLSTAGQGTLIDDVLRSAEYTNAAGSAKGYANYSRESLLASPPDAYIVTYEGEANDPMKAAGAIARLQADPVLGKLPCVRRDDVVFVPANWILRPGPRLVAGLMLLRAFHAQRLAQRSGQGQRANSAR